MSLLGGAYLHIGRPDFHAGDVSFLRYVLMRVGVSLCEEVFPPYVRCVLVGQGVSLMVKVYPCGRGQS